jgi:hypothetical protein
MATGGAADDKVAPTIELERVDDSMTVSETTVDIVGATFAKSNRLLSPEKSGKNRVHQNAILIPRLMTRCWRMNKTTRRKKMNADMISMRSSQSAFSRAFIRRFEVSITSVNRSCADEVAFKEVLDASAVRSTAFQRQLTGGHYPTIVLKEQNVPTLPACELQSGVVLPLHRCLPSSKHRPCVQRQNLKVILHVHT